MVEPVVAFAVATVPDVAGARRLHGFEGLEDADVVRALRQLRFQATGDDTLPPHLCRVTDLALVTADAEGCRVESPEGDERALLQAFAGAIESRRPVSWDAEAFELPALRYRALVNGVPLAGGPEHLALMPALSGACGPAASLAEVAALLGLPRPPVPQGDDPAARRAACETAAVATYLLYLRHCRLGGRLDADGLVRACERLRGELRRLPGAHWRAFLDADWAA